MHSEEQLGKYKQGQTLPDKQTDLDGTSKAQVTIEYLDTDKYTKRVNGEEIKDIPK